MKQPISAKLVDDMQALACQMLPFAKKMELLEALRQACTDKLDNLEKFILINDFLMTWIKYGN